MNEKEKDRMERQENLNKFNRQGYRIFRCGSLIFIIS